MPEEWHPVADGTSPARLMRRCAADGASTVTAGTRAVGTAVVLPLSWVGIALIGLPQTRSQDWSVGWEVWVLLVFATLGPLVITNILWFHSLDRIGASRATLATNLQPFAAAICAVVLDDSTPRTS